MAQDPWRIDVHAHILPQFYMDAVSNSGVTRSKGKPYPDWTEDLYLKLMDKNNIRTCINSISTPHVYFGDKKQAIDLARRCNEFSAEMVARRPDRFGTFAVLPLPDIEASCREAEYALDEMKVDGIVVLASYGHKFFGGPEFDPLFEILDRRKAVVFLHPTQHPEATDLDLDLPLFVAEYPINTARAALNLITKDVIRRYANISFILAHAGGVLPYLTWRLAIPRVPPVFKMSPHDAVRHFYYDIALAAGRQSLATLTEVADPSRILFGSDWPYTRDETVELTVKDFTEITFLTDAEKLAIEVHNSIALFPRLTATI